MSTERVDSPEYATRPLFGTRKEEFVFNGPCEQCGANTRFYLNCPRLSMGWNICPKCSPKEYYSHWPPAAVKAFREILKDDVKKSEARLAKFDSDYRENPLKVMRDQQKKKSSVRALDDSVFA